MRGLRALTSSWGLLSSRQLPAWTSESMQCIQQLTAQIPAPGEVDNLHVRWASKKQGGSTQNHRGQIPKHLGFKLFGSHLAHPGNIILRQRGQRWRPGQHVGMGKDYTLYALVKGWVQMYHNKHNKLKYVWLVPFDQAATEKQAQAVKKAIVRF